MWCEGLPLLRTVKSIYASILFDNKRKENNYYLVE